MPRGRVVAFGVFDLLHPGHLSFLHNAKKYGRELVVVVTRDSRARREKGKSPIFSQSERLRMIKSLSCVDLALLGDRPGFNIILERLHPEVIALGHDQSLPVNFPKKWRLVRIPARLPGRYGASRLRRRLSQTT